MGIEQVRAYFTKLGRGGDVLEFPVSSATVSLAAQALDTQEARIAKSLSFWGADGRCLLVVTAGDAKVDNRKFKDTFGIKARMLPHDAALELTGHPVGGVCPFVLPEGVDVRLDASLRRFETVFPACGSANSAIELTPEELESYTGATWVDVTKY